MANLWKLFTLWRRFILWWRSIFIAFGTKAKIDWFKKVDDMTSIANDALDQGGFTPTPTPTPAPAPAPAPVNTDSTVPANKPSNRLIDRLRKRRQEPKPEPTPPSPAPVDGYKTW